MSIISVSFQRKLANFLIVLHDSFFVFLSWFIAYFFRYGIESIFSENFKLWIEKFPFFIVPQIFFFFFFKTYSIIWRYISIRDLKKIVKTVSFGYIFGLILLFTVKKFQGNGYIPFIIYPFLVVGFLSINRIIMRFVFSHKEKLENNFFNRILVVGGGKASELLLRNIFNHNGQDFPGERLS